jgi:FtsP/CotA-like multicopper oxidase with cupredoxin domain
LTAEQVYCGLASLITVTKTDEQKLDLPSVEFDLPLVIQDRRFDAKNQLQYRPYDAQTQGRFFLAYHPGQRQTGCRISGEIACLLLQSSQRA